MACGVHLGIILICLVQAEHVHSLWATQAQSSWRQNGNKNVGLSQHNSGPGRFGGSYSQNQLRQASAQSSSFNTETALSSTYRKGYSSSGYAQTLSQPAQRGPSTVQFKLVQSSLLSKPNWQVTKSHQVNAQKVPKKRPHGLKADIATGTSLASKIPAYGQTSFSPRSSKLFSAGAPVLQKNSVRRQTSASAPARRVSSHRTSKPSHFSSSRNERNRNHPSKVETGKTYKSKLFPKNGGNPQGSCEPPSICSKATNYASYSPSLPVSNKQRPKSTGQRLGYKPRDTTTNPISDRNRQGKSQIFAPTRTHNVPQRFGGYAIRRLKKRTDQKTVSVRKPQQTYTALSWRSEPSKSHVQSAHKESKWQRIRPSGMQAGAAGFLG
uniref:uncharacterized protein LOC124074928 n=1 Tax=Scatophagus argus TaxID=75038 RepID=UPI001ED8395A|nr:uncharacterized protein LOC124074928 [Scatophagus argus]